MPGYRYRVLDRISKKIVVEYDAQTAKEAVQMYDKDGYKESTHFLMVLIDTIRARRTQEEIDMSISMGGN